MSRWSDLDPQWLALAKNANYEPCVVHSGAMKSELNMVWGYVRAVLRQWWVIVVEVVLVATDVYERVVGTWLLPSTSRKIGIGVAALIIAQYRAYRELLCELQSEMAGKTVLTVFSEPGSTLYIERPGGAARSIGFYLSLAVGIQNDGRENSVIRTFQLAIEETGAALASVVPTRRNMVQTRGAQHLMRNDWISPEPAWIVVPAHDVRAGRLGFYVPGEVAELPPQIHCRLTIGDTAGSSAEFLFTVAVQD